MGATTYGYGRMRWNGRIYLAHRLAWSSRNGDIPKGLCILHRCDTPPCVNPDHLFIGTHADNSDDKIRKGRLRYGWGPGRRNGNARLTAEGASIKSSPLNYRDTASKFNISVSRYYQIRNGKAWRHFQEGCE